MVHQGWSGVVDWLIVMSLTFPYVPLQVGQDVEDEDTIKAVEVAVRESTSVRKIQLLSQNLNWTNVVTAVLKGVAENTSLRELSLQTPAESPLPQDVVAEVKQKRRRLVMYLY